MLLNHILEHSIFYLHPCYGGQIPKPYLFLFSAPLKFASKSFKIFSAALKNNIPTGTVLEFAM